MIGRLKEGIVRNSYAVGKVTAYEDSGGLVGTTKDGLIVGSYYDKQTSGQNDLGKGVPRSTSEMKKATFYDWDFNSIWTINEGRSYPTLMW